MDGNSQRRISTHKKLPENGETGQRFIMSDIAELRNQIDEINLQLLELLNKRASLASQIGKIQTKLGSQIYDPVREGQMLTDLEFANKGPFSNETIKALFKEIFKATLALEEKQAISKLMVNRKPDQGDTVIKLPEGVQIGGGTFQIIAGACAVESFEQTEAVAELLSEFGIKIMRGMAYKPRTSPYEFQGLGEPGLKIAREVANKYGMLVTSEIMDASQIPMFADYVDILWVGARNMQNAWLLKALGKVPQPVILKRGFGNNIKEWLSSAEYIISSGNPNVIFMERGIRTFETETRNTLDISAVPVLKTQTHLPVIVDISHSAGRRDIAVPLARVAKASGADGMMVEVHPNPPVAMSDAKQQLYFDEFRAVMRALQAMAMPEPV
jgi:3-deoxy-7-phosphoheptulonate synthase / chorismate mutase